MLGRSEAGGVCRDCSVEPPPRPGESGSIGSGSCHEVRTGVNFETQVLGDHTAPTVDIGKGAGDGEGREKGAWRQGPVLSPPAQEASAGAGRPAPSCARLGPLSCPFVHLLSEAEFISQW